MCCKTLKAKAQVGKVMNLMQPLHSLVQPLDSLFFVRDDLSTFRRIW